MHFRSTSFTLFLIAACLVSFAGCLHLRPASPPLENISDPAQYLHDVLKAEDSYRFVSGLTKVELETPGKNVTSKNAITAQRPYFVRFEALDFFKQTSLLFVTDGTHLQLFVPSQKSFYSGPATEENIFAIIGIRLRAQDMVPALMGFPPLVLSSSDRITYRQDRNYYLFDIIDARKSQHVWINPFSKRIEHYVCFEDDRERYAFHFSDFIELQGLEYPTRIEFYYPRDHTRISLYYQSLHIEPPPPDTFILSPPQQAIRLPIEDFIATK